MRGHVSAVPRISSDRKSPASGPFAACSPKKARQTTVFGATVFVCNAPLISQEPTSLWPCPVVGRVQSCFGEFGEELLPGHLFLWSIPFQFFLQWRSKLD